MEEKWLLELICHQQIHIPRNTDKSKKTIPAKNKNNTSWQEESKTRLKHGKYIHSYHFFSTFYQLFIHLFLWSKSRKSTMVPQVWKQSIFFALRWYTNTHRKSRSLNQPLEVKCKFSNIAE